MGDVGEPSAAEDAGDQVADGGAVAVGGRRRRLQRGQVGGDGEDLGALAGAEPDGPGGFAAVQLGSGVPGSLQRGFPFGLAAPLTQRGIVASLDLIRGIDRGLQRQRGEDFQDVPGDGRVVRRPLTLVQNRPCPPPASTPPLHW